MVNTNICYKWWSVGLIKGAVIAMMLFVLTMWPATWELAQTVDPWCYLVVGLLFGARPAYRFWLKNS